MQKISIHLAVSFWIIAGILGFGAGYALTPEYQLSMYDNTEMDLGTADKWLDLRYLNAMISHHQGAILLAEQAKLSEREDIAALAEEILTNEPKLIAELFEWKEEWYNDSRTVQNPIVPNLGDYDDTFDLRFLNALISHHEDGIEMTQEVKTKSSRTEVLDNANAVENFLTESLKTLKDWRSTWYSL